ECGQPTCMVFAARVAEGAKGPEDCPPLKEESTEKPVNLSVRHKRMYRKVRQAKVNSQCIISN
ncbi:MAG: (Fe-S)-binding protein, partial [Psychroflexus sp.]